MQLGQVIEFTVLGTPRSQGSMKSMLHRRTKQIITMASSPKMKPWRQEISWAALRARGPGEPAGRNVAIRLEASFFFAKPKSSKLNEKTSAPDIDKLLRCCLDAMTGIIYEDDSQIVEIHCFKGFGQPRVEVRVSEPQPVKNLPF
jgi:crossover junction endodeoxyribonuclease RusA